VGVAEIYNAHVHYKEKKTMANHGYVKSKRIFKKDEVFKEIQEINQRRFDGKLNIEDSDYGDLGSWFISHAVEESTEGFNIWIASPKKLEHRHTRCWATYLEIVFANELGVKYDGIMSDDGVSEKWKPRPEKYPTFLAWLDVLYGHIKESKPDSFKTAIEFEMMYCPEELIKY